MSDVLVSIVIWTPSMLFSRSVGESVDGAYDGLRTMFMNFVGSKPEIGLIVLQLEVLILSSPWIMYGPDEMTSRP